MSAPQPVELRVSRRTKIGASVVVALQIGLLMGQFALQRDQQSTTDQQLATAVTQLRESLPILRESRPVVRAQREQLDETRRFTKEGTRLAVETRPLVQELRAARIDDTTRATGRLAVELLGADVPRLAQTIDRADLPRATTSLNQIAGELLTEQRLRRLLVRTNAVLGETQARNLIEKAARAAELAPQTNAVTLELLATQKRALAVLEEALPLIREAERHAESLDRKTGGVR